MFEKGGSTNRFFKNMSFAILALWYVMLERWACISGDMQLGRIIVQTLQKFVATLGKSPNFIRTEDRHRIT